MRDIGSRIQRYRLSRYAMPEDKVGRRLRWAWLLAALWVVWVGFLSDHNFYRLFQLGHEASHERSELARIDAEVARLDAVLSDPGALRRQAEAEARRNGMARPGDIIYRIDDKKSPRTAP